MTAPRQIKTLDQLAAAIRSDPDLEKKFKADPANTLEQMRFWQIPNTTVYKIVVSSLGAAVIVSLLGAILITLNLGAVENIPDILVATASAAVGALAGLLAPQPNENN